MWSSNSNGCVCFVCAHLCVSLSALIKKQPDAKKVKQVLSLQSCAQLFHSQNEIITPQNNLPQFCSFLIHHSPNSSILFNKYINYPSLFLWLKELCSSVSSCNLCIWTSFTCLHDHHVSFLLLQGQWWIVGWFCSQANACLLACWTQR